MGGDWHMPTDTQLEELASETNHEWITDYQGSGINGMLFISKTDSTKSVFIPASGNRWDTSVDSQGDYAILWSSSLMTDDPGCSWYLSFDSDDCFMDYYCGRCGGSCVRGVIG